MSNVTIMRLLTFLSLHMHTLTKLRLSRENVQKRPPANWNGLLQFRSRCQLKIQIHCRSASVHLGLKRHANLNKEHKTPTLYVLIIFADSFPHYIQTITFIPNASPAMTLTVTPSLVALGMSLSRSSWYAGSIILYFLARLTHNWRPWTSPSPCGISQWTIPRPAVIHCQMLDRSIKPLYKKLAFLKKKFILNQLTPVIKPIQYLLVHL